MNGSPTRVCGSMFMKNGREEREQDRAEEEPHPHQKRRRLQEPAEELHRLPPACAARMRGSRRPMMMSTLKFAMSTQTVTSSVHPVMSG